MITRAKSCSWQIRFLEMLPAIRRQARIAFAHFTPESRDDAVYEVVASCYVAYARLVQRNREDLAYPSVLAGYAVRQFHDGRRVGSRANRNDIYAVVAQRQKGHALHHIGAPAEQIGGWKEMLIDDRRTPPPDQAAFRIDFSNWLRTLTDRNRRVAEKFAIGERTKEVGVAFGLSSARVSQLRRELRDQWLRFQGEEPEGC